MVTLEISQRRPRIYRWIRKIDSLSLALGKLQLFQWNKYLRHSLRSILSDHYSLRCTGKSVFLIFRTRYFPKRLVCQRGNRSWLSLCLSVQTQTWRCISAWVWKMHPKTELIFYFPGSLLTRTTRWSSVTLDFLLCSRKECATCVG